VPDPWPSDGRAAIPAVVTGFGFVRSIALLIGVLLVVAGFLGITVGGSGMAAFGIWNVALGLLVVAAVLLERTRYRSEPGERFGATPGLAGGEPSGTVLEPRFHRTDETFEDPTTRRVMRVWLDPQSGERRYLHED